MISTKDKQRFINIIKSGNLDHALLLANECSLAFPEDPEGYNMVADAFRLKGEFDFAHKFYTTSLEKNNQQVHIMLMLGLVNTLLGRINEADVMYYNALELAPEDSHVLNKCGVYYFGKGEIESSKFLLKRAIELGNFEAYESLLELYVFVQDKKNIKFIIESHLQYLSTDSLVIAKGYFQLKKYKEAISCLEAIDVASKTAPWKSSYYQLLGFAFEKLKNYSAAFNAFKLQNKCSDLFYSKDETEQYTQQIVLDKQTANNGLMKQKKVASDRTSPLFILGAPRSGSSLIEQILNTNKQIALGGELTFIASAFQSWLDEQNSLPELAVWYRDKLEFYVNANQQDQSTKWVTDKMPANWQYIGFILNLCPDAKIIYTKRNAMDIGLSIYKQNMVSAHQYATDLKNIAHHIYLVETTMQHWLSLYPKNILMVEYETLVQHFNEETKKIMSFLNLKWDRKCADFYKNDGITLTASRDQVKSPLYQGSIKAYVHYEKYLGDLKKELQKYNIKFL